MTDDSLLTYVISIFREKFGPTMQDGDVTYLPGETSIAIITPTLNPSERMAALARVLEAAFEELDLYGHLHFKREMRYRRTTMCP
jgi:hypothetical protein